MKGKNTSAIGKREERQIVKDLEARGYSARRQPGSGNRAFDLQHDILWRDSPAGKLHIEDKYRDECRWKTLEKWKQGADILTVRQARGERMAFLSWKLLLELVGPANKRQCLGLAEAVMLDYMMDEDGDNAGNDFPYCITPRMIGTSAQRVTATQSLLTGKTGKAKPKPNRLGKR